MKDFANKLHKPQQPKPWSDVAREMTENLIFVTITGIALVSVGVGLWFLPAGIIVAGVGLVLFGLALERGK